jgi:alpha-amylase/alpha-mannosidase (GH57 family)
MPSFCLHAHFYQPPRGNPFVDMYGSDDVGHEPGAEPYNNWNEKVTAECYLPNAELGNFELASFDVGATLLRWMERNAPNTYRLIIDADQKHVAQYGLGNALATPSHHTILPLARKRDKVSQVLWGVAGFVYRYGRQPQGMWLPEMAVDLETLQIFHDLGIKFTILSQAQVVGATDGGPYWVALPDGGRMTVYIRDDSLSNQLAFNIRTLGGAGKWARSVLTQHSKEAGAGRLTLLAVEGETFGHHHSGEEHFLHWLLSYEANAVSHMVTTLERDLRDNPPKTEVTIKEYTSWSCPHGLGRYAAGCDCTPGASNWKGALRRALDNLSNNIDDLYVNEVEPTGVDPWKLRNEYVKVTLGQADVTQVMRDQGITEADDEVVGRIGNLLAASYFRQRMYTASTFKYEDLSRAEPRYAIANGLQAIYLTQQATGADLLPAYRRDLAQATSNKTGQSGAQILDELIEQSQNSVDSSDAEESPA